MDWSEIRWASQLQPNFIWAKEKNDTSSVQNRTEMNETPMKNFLPISISSLPHPAITLSSLTKITTSVAPQKLRLKWCWNHKNQFLRPISFTTNLCNSRFWVRRAWKESERPFTALNGSCVERDDESCCGGCDCGVGSVSRCFIRATELKRMRESRFHRTRFLLWLQYFSSNLFHIQFYIQIQF